MSQPVPHDLDAEESLLGAMLLSRNAVTDVIDVVSAPSFYKPTHGLIFQSICDVHALGAPIDHVTVAAILDRSKSLERVGGKPELLRLQTSVPASAHATAYAQVVADLATARIAIDLAESIRRAGYDADLPEVSRLLATAGERLAVTTAPIDVGVDVRDLAHREYSTNWLVPNLLERGDRIMLSGPEGWGKTTLLRQIGLQLACGIHPFKARRVPHVKVLMLDCENSDAQNTRAFHWLLRRCDDEYPDRQMIVVNRRQGLNLRSAGDARWVDGLLAHHRPDLLVCGPLYKMFEGSSGVRKDSEEAADEVARTFDRLRVKHDCALLIEAHAPHGDGGDRAGYRPYGASLWMRWPEFGLGLKPDGDRAVELVHWRGARDRDRDFPARLWEGSFWPWEADAAWLPPSTEPEQSELLP